MVVVQNKDNKPAQQESGFLPGLVLSEAFYNDVVSAIVGPHPHAACLIGKGSEVLGFDTARSTDHGWGPRLQVFLSREHVEPVKRKLEALLPDDFMGWPVRFPNWQKRPSDHHVDVANLKSWMMDWFGFDPREGMTIDDWLSIPQQLLLEATSGAIFRDDSGEMASLRTTLRWFPKDVWLFYMASQWQTIASVKAIPGRTNEIGDEVGSRLATNKIANAIIRLCFLQSQQYVPFDKWLGTAVSRLPIWARIGPSIKNMIKAKTYTEREDQTIRALSAIGDNHNNLNVTDRVNIEIETYRVFAAERPYLVINAGDFWRACAIEISNEQLARTVKRNRWPFVRTNVLVGGNRTVL